MASEISKLFVTLAANTKEFFKSMNEAQKTLQNFGTNVSDIGKGFTKNVTTPLVAVGAGLFGIAKKTANAGDEIQKMALRTGISTEALSELKFAAELSGSSIDGVETGVKRMQRTLFDAEKGLSTSTDALDALNLSSTDLEGLSPEDQFNTLAGSIGDIEDPSKRAALAQEIFGRAGTDLLPLFSAGADGMAAMRQEARDLGIVFDQEAADAAAQFNDDLARLQGSMAGVFQELGTQLIPIIVDQLIPAIQNNVIPLIRSFGERLGELINWFKNLSPETQKMIGIAIGIAAALGPVLIVVGKLIVLFGTILSPIGLVVAAIVGLIAIFVLLFNTNETFRDGVLVIWEKIKEFGMQIFGTLKEALAEIFGDIKETAIVVFEAFQKFWDEWGGTILILAEGAWNNIKTVIETAINIIKDVIGLVMAVIRGDWDEVWEKIKSIATTLVTGIRDVIDNTLSTVIKILSDIWDKVKDGVMEKWEDIKGAVSDGITNALDFILGLGSKFFDAGKGLIDQIVGGIKSAASAVKDTVSNVTSGIRDFLPFSPAKVGPLSDLDKLDFGGPITASIQADTTDVQRSMSQLLQPPDVSRNITPGTSTPVSFEGMFSGANITVRNDDDIRKLSREVGNITISKLRGAGVL